MASQYQAIDSKLFDTEQEAAAHNMTLGNYLCDMTVKQLEALCMDWQVPWRGQKKARLVAHLMGAKPRMVGSESKL